MKKGVKITLIIISAIAVIAAGTLAATILFKPKIGGNINATAHGVVADDPSAAKKNTKALNSLIKNAEDGTVIELPKGDYYIAASLSGGIIIDNKSNLTIKGDGACIINTSFSPDYFADVSHYMDSNIFVMKSSKNITIEGISLDYEKHTNICGVATDTGNGLLTLEAYDEFLTGDNAVKGDEFITSVCVFNEDGAPVNEMYLSEPEKLTLLDAENGVFDMPLGIGEKGQQVCIRFSNGTYSCPTFSVNGVDGLTMKNIWVKSSPSASVYVMDDNSNFTFDNFKVAPEEGSKRLFASNEDCIHIKGVRGELTLKNCEFNGIGDDALNIHSLGGHIASINGKTADVVNGRDGDALKNWAKAGDSIDIYTEDFELLGFAEVVKVSGNKLELDNLPAGMDNKSILHNSTRLPSVTVDNCSVTRARARSFLIQAPKAAITNCSFEKTGLPALLVAPDIANWHEMGPCEELTVTGNSFKQCSVMRNTSFSGAITVSLNHDLASPTANQRPHGSITVTDNTFEGCSPKAIFICGAKSTKVENNNLGGSITDVK